jgi:MFS transporter, AAHS family, 4-hydroxybenzoate transporter
MELYECRTGRRKAIGRSWEGAVDAPRIDFNTFLDGRPVTGFQVSVVALCAFVAMLDGFDTQAIAYVAPVIAAEWEMKVSAFGPIFGAGLFGLMIGALAIGPVADRFGRKSPLIASVVMFGICSLVTPFARSFQSLLYFRLLTGLGLGGAMPILIALTSEYSPARLQATVVTVMFCGVPLGALLGGLASTWMVPTLGWPSVFYLGATLPITIAIVLAVLLPESLRFLIAMDAPPEKMRPIIARLAPDEADRSFVLTEEKVDGTSVAQLFTVGRLSKTLILWFVFFMNLLVMYFLINWLPTLVREAGLSIGIAILSTVLFNFGGIVGGVALGRLIDWIGPYCVLTAAYIFAGICIAIMAASASDIVMLLCFVFLAGAGILGAQLGMNALTAQVYPTTIRCWLGTWNWPYRFNHRSGTRRRSHRR